MTVYFFPKLLYKLYEKLFSIMSNSPMYSVTIGWKPNFISFNPLNLLCFSNSPTIAFMLKYFKCCFCSFTGGNFPDFNFADRNSAYD